MRRLAATIGVPVRLLAAVVGVMLVMLVPGPVALGATPPAKSARSAQATLASSLNSTIRHAGGHSGAYVLDLDTGSSLFSYSPDVGRLPASVEKLYTTSTALLRLRREHHADDLHLGVGTLNNGHWTGTLYIKGGGDPTFGSASFDHFAYGGGATMQRLVANLIRTQGITSIQGRVIGDESYFDSLRGTPATGFRFSTDVEGSLSALVYNRGLINQGSSYVLHPALFAAQQFVSALRSAGVKVAQKLPIATGRTPAGDGPAGRGQLTADGDADQADQHALGQLLRRDADQGHRREVRRRRHHGRGSRRRPQPGRVEVRNPPAAQRRLGTVAHRTSRRRARS